MQKKRSILAAAAFFMLALVLFGVWRFTRQEAVEGAKTVTVTVTHGDGRENEFTYRTDLESLGGLLMEEGLISGTEGAYGLFVDTVDGETADYSKDGAWWSLICNGERSTVGVDSVMMQDGDVYGWVYTTG